VEALNGVDPVVSPPTDASYRAAFTAWLGGLGSEARQLGSLLVQDTAPEPVRRFAAETLNQLLHAVDLVPEGVEALGYLEALFAFRVLAREACAASWQDPSGTLSRLAAEAELVEAFLGVEDYARLSAIVLAQRERRSRGRSPAELLEASEARNATAQETQSWAERYRPASFGSGSHDLVRLLSFLRTRVRRVPRHGAATAATAE
jgi:hypothetical protein